MVLWDEVAFEVSKDYPDVKWDKMLVDAMTCRMVLDPKSLDTIVATNLVNWALKQLFCESTNPHTACRHSVRFGCCVGRVHRYCADIKS